MVFLNHEAAPESDTIGDWFKEVRQSIDRYSRKKITPTLYISYISLDYFYSYSLFLNCCVPYGVCIVHKEISFDASCVPVLCAHPGVSLQA